MIEDHDVGSKDIRKVEAHGNVEVRKDGRVASRTMRCIRREETIVHTGNASIIENETSWRRKNNTFHGR